MQTILSLDGPLPACSGLLLALLLLVLLDYINGVCVAIQNKPDRSQGHYEESGDVRCDRVLPCAGYLLAPE